MALAIFDLDHTLLAGDSDHLWGEFLVEQQIVDGESYARENDRFYEAYQNGDLDILEYLAFALKPLADNTVEDLERWRATFIEEKIQPLVHDEAQRLVTSHRRRGDTLLIITATNRFITEPIAELFGIDKLLATTPEKLNGRYTGHVTGTPTFREGKVKALREWLAATGHDLESSWFYSDSHNDIPLLERVDNPVAVDPDPTLREHADEAGWRIISLHNSGEMD